MPVLDTQRLLCNFSSPDIFNWDLKKYSTKLSKLTEEKKKRRKKKSDSLLTTDMNISAVSVLALPSEKLHQNQ